jgi:uroporphyrinogen III methyltransferase/synthase
MRIGTRGSVLALTQTQLVAGLIAEAHPDVGAPEIVVVHTRGDRDAQDGDKSRWVAELEQALLAGDIDLAVHSAKDVPGAFAEGLQLLGAPVRAAAEDALIGASSLAELRRGARVGTSSVRRAAQLRSAREDLEVVSMSGNVDTRLRKLGERELDAIVLASAGLQRLGRNGDIGCTLDIAHFVPAPGQGLLALQGRAEDARVRAAVETILDQDASACLQAERAVARALGASCNTPLGAYAAPAGCGCLHLRAWVGLPDGSAWLLDELLGGFYDPEELGARVAARLEAAGARELLERAEETAVEREHPESTRSEGTRPRTGRVYLVGAGPGDPGLLTARALELIARADTILYDRLIPAGALDGARADAELLFVGKMSHHPGGESVPQEHTQALMIERARAGREVVRLKGGDPFVFGRGGEEALALRDAGIEFLVVPGVTAGVAAAAYAGIPVTHRGMSTAVALVTGHTRESTPKGAHPVGTGRAGDGDGEALTSAGREQADATASDSESGEPIAELDWQALAAFPGTLVFYMGVRQLPHIAAELIAAGRAGTQPVALVEHGTLPDQRTVAGTLATIAELARREQVKAPAITIVGAVTELTNSLNWLPPRPLAGRTVTVTRARAQASELVRRLGELGATVVQAPTIRTRTLDGPPLDPAPYDLICVASPNGVHALFERLAAGGLDARSLARSRIAAIGPGTARALAEHGIAADVVPERFVAESLLDALADLDVNRALVARAIQARDVLPDALRARGVEVDVLALYETIPEPLSARALARARAADYITFSSSSTVRHFLNAAGAAEADGHSQATDTSTANDPLSPSTRIVSIGPATSATLREHNLEPHLEAQQHDIDGLVDALLTDARSRGD